MTGHLVLTTLHAQTAASAIQRLTDMDIERSILATSINCVACGSPAVLFGVLRFDVTPGLLQTLRVPDMHGELNIYKAVGCPECSGTGYGEHMQSSRC